MPASSSTCRICATSGAESIGLFRTELQFMMAQRFPRLDTQVRHYRGIIGGGE